MNNADDFKLNVNKIPNTQSETFIATIRDKNDVLKASGSGLDQESALMDIKQNLLFRINEGNTAENIMTWLGMKGL